MPSAPPLSSHHSRLLAAALVLASNSRCVLVVEIILPLVVLVAVTLMFRGRDPQTRLPV